MNREQRRRQARAEKKNPNSKNNFRFGSTQMIPVDQIENNPDLKDCDNELLEFLDKAYDWKISKKAAQNIIDEGLKYLDSLCSLRFDATPTDDKKLVRNSMRFVSDLENMFLGLYYEHDKCNITLNDVMEEARANGQTKIPLNTPQHEEIAPMYGDVLEMPSREDVDDIYAGFVVGHANDYAQLIHNTSMSEIAGDELHVFDVILMISKKTMEFMTEAETTIEYQILKCDFDKCELKSFMRFEEFPNNTKKLITEIQNVGKKHHWESGFYMIAKCENGIYTELVATLGYMPENSMITKIKKGERNTFTLTFDDLIKGDRALM